MSTKLWKKIIEDIDKSEMVAGGSVSSVKLQKAKTPISN